MKQFLSICVEKRDSVMTKDGLHQYRNISQHQAPASLEAVINFLLNFAQRKINEALEKCQIKLADTPVETILLNQVNVKTMQERLEDDLALPWVQYTWETFRTVLDILSNNQTLHGLYHSICERAHVFLVKHNRKSDFRRACDVIRKHLANIHRLSTMDPANLKPWQKMNGVKLTHSVIELQLQTRFSQLKSAAKLQLWNQAFNTMDEIQGIFEMGQKMPSPQTLAKYYALLTSVMWSAGNMLLHAFCMYEEYKLRKKHQKGAKLGMMATQLMLAAMCVPQERSQKKRIGGMDIDQEKNRRMAHMLNLTADVPSRTLLLEELRLLKVERDVTPELRPLFGLLRDKFNALGMVKEMQQMMEIIKKEPLVTKYVQPMQRLVVIALMKQLAQVYKTVKMSHFQNLIAGFNVSFHDVETYAVQAVRARQFSVCIDHKSGTLHFGGEGVESQRVHSQLSQLSNRLNAVVRAIAPAETPQAMQKESAARASFFAKVLSEASVQHPENLKRKDIIEEKKWRREKIAMMKADELKALEMERERKRKHEEKQWLAEERVRRQKAKEKQEAELKRKAALLAKAKAYDPKVDVNGMSIEEIGRLEVARKEKEVKRKIEHRKKLLLKARNIDYQIRALREAEIPLLEAHFEKVQTDNNLQVQAEFEKFKSDSRERYNNGIIQKKRLSKVASHLPVFIDLLHRGRVEIEKGLAYKRAKIRRAMERQEEEERRMKKEEEEEERRQQEEVERIRLEEEAEAERIRAEEAAEKERIQAQEEAEEARKQEARQRREEDDRRAEEERSRRRGGGGGGGGGDDRGGSRSGWGGGRSFGGDSSRRGGDDRGRDRDDRFGGGGGGGGRDDSRRGGDRDRDDRFGSFGGGRRGDDRGGRDDRFGGSRGGGYGGDRGDRGDRGGGRSFGGGSRFGDRDGGDRRGGGGFGGGSRFGGGGGSRFGDRNGGDRRGGYGGGGGDRDGGGGRNDRDDRFGSRGGGRDGGRDGGRRSFGTGYGRQDSGGDRPQGGGGGGGGGGIGGGTGAWKPKRLQRND